MQVYLTVVFGLIGAAIGSFLNVVVDRLPANHSVSYPPSHCDGCQTRLAPVDLVPVISYLALRGRCRYCQAKIPLQVLLVELGCGLWTAFLFWSKGETLSFGVTAFYSYIFIAIGLIDLRHQLILNAIVYPSYIAALIIAPFFIKAGVVHTSVVDYGIVNALIGAGVGFVFLLIPFVVSRGGMAFGDVEMAALIGLATGFGEVLVAILGGMILGGLVAIFLLALRIKKLKEAIPFGPFLALAAIVTLVWGTQILQWWLGLFS
jgi:leader peptidase (prepilin peptidase)/N-methyltransferase